MHGVCEVVRPCQGGISIQVTELSARPHVTPVVQDTVKSVVS